MIDPSTLLSKRRAFRKKFAITTFLVAVVVCIPVALLSPIDQTNVPLCNKQTLVEVQNWFDHEESRDLPNIGGRSVESLIKLKQGDDAEQWNAKYRYVPGLRRGDPGDLVLMYMKKPTRWKHHAAGPSSIFRESKWIIVPLDFTGFLGGEFASRVDREMPDTGEEAERVSLEEFKVRLQKTLQFLRENDRPHWQTIVAENEEFLKSLTSE